MTEEERKKMMNLADMIEGEINRMCVTKDLSELDTMALYARKNIEKLQNMRYADFKCQNCKFYGHELDEKVGTDVCFGCRDFSYFKLKGENK